jgi:hypothetical protein
MASQEVRPVSQSVPLRAAVVVLSCGFLVVPSASAAVVVPGPDFKSIADRVHALTVLVRARAFVLGRDAGGRLHVDEGVSATSGVLVGDALAVTDLASVTLPGKDGKPEPVAAIEVVLPEVGTVPALVAAVDTGLGIAVLRLPDATRELPGAVLAPGDGGESQTRLAIGADDTHLRVVSVLVGGANESGSRLAIDRALPDFFRGGPLFDAQGHLAGVMVGAGAAVSSSQLRALLDKLAGAGGI